MTHTPELTTVLKELKQLTGIDLPAEQFDDGNASITAEELHNLCVAYREKYDKTHFFQNIVKGQLSVYDINEQAAKLHIESQKLRQAFLLESSAGVDDTLLSVLRHLCPAQNGSILFPISEERLMLLYPVSDRGIEEADILQLAHSISDTLNMELLISVHVACGPQIAHLSELTDAYKKASLALEVGKMFHAEQHVFLYDHLRTGRLIYHLPTSVCEDFLDEIFRGNVPSSIDSEMLTTINRFLQNNMNIAETARQLHMHRNTLIYRIEQVEKQTGLDIRKFEDAMTYKTALMVMNYLK